MHSGTLLFAWLCVVVGMQALPGLPLMVLLVIVAALFGSGERRRWMVLLRRSRWLIVVLALTFILSTPGEALIPGFPGTWEGLAACAEHLGRFVLLLAAVACLLEKCGRNELVAGLYCLAQPLRRFGLPVERAAARLALVFEYVEGAPDGRAAPGWRVLLDEPSGIEPRPIEFEIPAMRAPDLMVNGLAIALIVLAISA